MRKPLEKIAMIAHAGISFIFVLLTVLILFNILQLMNKSLGSKKANLHLMFHEEREL